MRSLGQRCEQVVRSALSMYPPLHVKLSLNLPYTLWTPFTCSTMRSSAYGICMYTYLLTNVKIDRLVVETRSRGNDVQSRRADLKRQP